MNNNVSDSREKVNNCKNGRSVSKVHPMQDCWEHAPPRPYQTANQNGNIYFHSAQCTHKRPDFVGPRQRQRKPFHCVELRGGSTIVGIIVDWTRQPNGITSCRFIIRATPTDRLADHSDVYHMGKIQLGPIDRPGWNTSYR